MAIRLGNKTRVSIVAAVCLLGLVVALKNLLRVPAESINVVLFIIIYSTFSIVYPEPAEATRSRWDRPLYWSLLIVLVTAAIIAVYAVRGV